MPIEPGQNLLHYRLIDKIGEGGMGVVWRAEDTTLKREVAIKILPFTGTDLKSVPAERFERFAREARLLATLNHPNIASVYGLHECDNIHFLAMELIRGEDLSERIARGPIPVDDAMEIARAIAEALRAAHANGVIHRDLKPANIRLGLDGEVKVLDFGLAKVLSNDSDDSSDGGSPSMSPTITSLGTVAGMILGTAAYMSPEQARGKTVDRRADVWAFGCVLFEMLTGQRVFPGETITDTLAAVIRAEPEWEQLPADLTPGLRRVLKLCLQKNPRERLHDIADGLLLLDEPIEEQITTAAEAAPPSRVREGLAWGLALIAIIFVVVMGLSDDEPTKTKTQLRFTIDLASDTPLKFLDAPILAFSPDGQKIAFTATDPSTGNSIIYLRALDQAEPWPIAGTENGSNPFFSPDGESLGFFSERQLKQIDLGGGTAVTLAPTPNPRGGVWLPDGTIVYSPEYSSGLLQISAHGGNIRTLVELDIEADERTFRWPTVLPDGKTLLYTIGSAQSPNNYDHASIAAYSMADGTRHTVLEGANMARFVPPNRLIFNRTGNLYAAEFDPKSARLLGEPVQVLEGVGGDPSSGAGYFDVSPGGDLILVDTKITDELANLVLVDREQKAMTLPVSPRGIVSPEFSPDGGSIAFSVTEGVGVLNGDIWIYTLADEGLRRLTFANSDFYPVWRQDGQRIAFVRVSESNITSVDVDSGGDARSIMPVSNDMLVLPGSWSADGRTMMFTRAERSTDILRLDLEDDREFETFVVDGSAPMISPDGHWLAYQSPSAGMGTIYVESLNGEGKWQVSESSGNYPRWSADGRKLFYINAFEQKRPMMVVDVHLTGGLRFSKPRVVLEDTTRYVTSTAPFINWDTDGERFVFVELVKDESAQSKIDVMLNWAAQF